MDRCHHISADSRDVIVASSSSGYIVNMMTSQPFGCHVSEIAWVIMGEVGQRVKLTLYDFSRYDNAHLSYQLGETGLQNLPQMQFEKHYQVYNIIIKTFHEGFR